MGMTISVSDRNIYQSLTGWFRGQVGFSGKYTGTTDADGLLVFDHNCGFEPSGVLVSRFDSTGTADVGAVTVKSFTDTGMVLRCLRAAGANSVSVSATVFYHILPKV